MKKKFFYTLLSMLGLLALVINPASFFSFFFLAILVVLLSEKMERWQITMESQILAFFSLAALVLILSNICSSSISTETGRLFLHPLMGSIAEVAIFASAVLAVSSFIASSLKNGGKTSAFFLTILLLILIGNSLQRGFSILLIIYTFIYAISRSFYDWPTQLFKFWLFIGLLAGWAFFLTMSKETLFHPAWCPGWLTSSLFFESLLRILFSVSLAVTLFLPVSLILGSRKTRMKTATSYFFLTIIPIIILVSLIWLNFFLQGKMLPVFLLWRENIGTLHRTTQKISLEAKGLLKDVSSLEEMTSTLNGIAQKYEDVLSLKFSSPSVFITVLQPDSGEPLVAASSANAAYIRPSNLLQPKWLKDGAKTWIFKENRKIFLKGVKTETLDRFKVNYRTYVPLEFQDFSDISPEGYQFLFQPGGERASVVRELREGDTGISLTFDEVMQILQEGRIPILAIDWNSGNYLVVGSIFTSPLKYFSGNESSSLIYMAVIYGLVSLASFFAFIAIILSSIMGYMINRTMRRSFEAIVEGAHHFSRGDFDHEIPVRSRDEYRMVAGALNQMAIGIKGYTEELIKKELMERELSIASEVQKKIFPASLPSRKDLDFGVVSRLAGKVGGDYYDFIEYSENELAVIIADASGKGMPAALMISSLNAILHSYTRPVRIVELLEMVNTRLRKVSTENAFISLVFGMFQNDGREMRYINAGHPYPILLKGNGECIELKDGGLSLGMLDAVEFREGCVAMETGDILIFVTDGVLETLSEMGEEFGSVRLKETVAQNRDRSAQKIAESLFEELKSFSGTEERLDDATSIIIKSQHHIPS
ncbi:MAG: PP2C family protein-serine/threonine phosphatase [Acidobacteriota bacterium]